MVCYLFSKSVFASLSLAMILILSSKSIEPSAFKACPLGLLTGTSYSKDQKLNIQFPTIHPVVQGWNSGVTYYPLSPHLCPFTNCLPGTSSVFLERVHFFLFYHQHSDPKHCHLFPELQQQPQPLFMNSVFPQNSLSGLQQSDLFKVKNMTKMQASYNDWKVLFICSSVYFSIMIAINTSLQAQGLRQTVNAWSA